MTKKGDDKKPKPLPRKVRKRIKQEGKIADNLAKIRAMKDCPECGNGSIKSTAGCGTCHGKGRVPR